MHKWFIQIFWWVYQCCARDVCDVIQLKCDS